MAIAPALTARQQDVVNLLSQGRTNKEIAAELGIGADAVKAHVSRMLARFGARNRLSLVAAVRREASLRDGAFGRTSASLGRIESGLGASAGTLDAGTLGAYDERIAEIIDFLGDHGSAGLLTRLGALRESLGAIRLAVEIASLSPSAQADARLLEAIKDRSNIAVANVVALERMIDLERKTPWDAGRRTTASARRSSRTRRRRAKP